MVPFINTAMAPFKAIVLTTNIVCIADYQNNNLFIFTYVYGNIYIVNYLG